MPQFLFYRPPDTIVRQGDIVVLAPCFLSVRPPLRALGGISVKAGGIYAEVFGAAGGRSLPNAFATGAQEKDLVSPAQLGFGLLLTRGCEVDHRKYRQVVPIRPLEEIQGADGRSAEENRAAVIEGQRFGMFYLPPVPVELGAYFSHSFVDFRRATTLHSTLFDQFTRPVALGREALQAVYLAWAAHCLGRTPMLEAACPSCSQVLALWATVQESVTPPEDF